MTVDGPSLARGLKRVQGASVGGTDQFVLIFMASGISAHDDLVRYSRLSRAAVYAAKRRLKTAGYLTPSGSVNLPEVADPPGNKTREMVLEALLLNADLSPTDLHLAMLHAAYIDGWGNDTKVCPGPKTLAKESGCGISTVKRYLKGLQERNICMVTDDRPDRMSRYKTPVREFLPPSEWTSRNPIARRFRATVEVVKNQLSLAVDPNTTTNLTTRIVSKGVTSLPPSRTREGGQALPLSKGSFQGPWAKATTGARPNVGGRGWPKVAPARDRDSIGSLAVYAVRALRGSDNDIKPFCGALARARAHVADPWDRENFPAIIRRAVDLFAARSNIRAGRDWELCRCRGTAEESCVGSHTMIKTPWKVFITRIGAYFKEAVDGENGIKREEYDEPAAIERRAAERWAREEADRPRREAEQAERARLAADEQARKEAQEKAEAPMRAEAARKSAEYFAQMSAEVAAYRAAKAEREAERQMQRDAAEKAVWNERLANPSPALIRLRAWVAKGRETA